MEANAMNDSPEKETTEKVKNLNKLANDGKQLKMSKFKDEVSACSIENLSFLVKKKERKGNDAKSKRPRLSASSFYTPDQVEKVKEMELKDNFQKNELIEVDKIFEEKLHLHSKLMSLPIKVGKAIDYNPAELYEKVAFYLTKNYLSNSLKTNQFISTKASTFTSLREPPNLQKNKEYSSLEENRLNEMSIINLIDDDTKEELNKSTKSPKLKAENMKKLSPTAKIASIEKLLKFQSKIDQTEELKSEIIIETSSSSSENKDQPHYLLVKGAIDTQLRSQNLYNLFRSFGKVESLYTNAKNDFALLEFKHSYQTVYAQKSLNDQIVCDCKLKVPFFFDKD